MAPPPYVAYCGTSCDYPGTITPVAPGDDLVGKLATKPRLLYSQVPIPAILLRREKEET